jgi:hypothetical protein
MFRLLSPRLYLIAGAALATLALLGGLHLALGHISAQRAEIEALERAADTMERIRNADTSSGNADADRDWLRERGFGGGR